MDKRLLSILRCPVSHKGLAVMRKDKLDQVNAAIQSGELQNHDGETLSEPLSSGLITDDGRRVYPIADGIPVLLEDESISVEQLA